jgi:hypothetical protein
MKVVIDNLEFDYDLGIKLLKLKYDTPIEGLENIWDSIETAKFTEICELENIEQRRVAINCYGLKRLHKELNAKLIDEKTIKKQTTWVLEDGTLETKQYDDVYTLYEIDGNIFNKEPDLRWEKFRNEQYIVFKDTSTDREYLLWINNSSVYSTNNNDKYIERNRIYPITATQAIAWTITTNIPEGNIKEIIRQGDCILIRPKDNNLEKLTNFRHLTEKEYLTLLTNES